MDENRLKHSLGVARKMVEIGKIINLNEMELNDLFTIGFVHDIGYEYTKNGINHQQIGGEILKNTNFKYWQEVYYHGYIQNEYSSLYLDILNEADMQVDKYGNDVGFKNRLEDIKTRYGENSNIYKKCYELIEFIKNKKEENKYDS